MTKLSWRQKEVIELEDAVKQKLIEEMKHKSLSEEKAIAREIERRIKHDIEVMANGQRLPLKKEDNEYYLTVYSGVQFYYPGPDGKLSGSIDATGVALEFIKKLLLKLSNHVVLKVVEGGTRYEYFKGEAELDPDLFDPEEADHDEFL